MNQALKKYLRNIFLILLIGSISIYFSIKDNYKEFINAFKASNSFWLLVIVALMFVYFCADGLILYLFGKLYNKFYSYKQAFVNSISGTFFCGITPFSSGGQFAQVYIFNKQGIIPTNSASILLMCFIVYQTVLVLYTAVILVFKFSYYTKLYSEFFSLAGLGFFVNFVVISSLFLGAKSKKIQFFFCNTVLKVMAKLHLIKNYEDTKVQIEIYLHNFRTELNNLQNNIPLLIESAFLNFVKLTILYSIPFFAAKALNLDVAYSQIFNFIGICSFVYMITAFIPIPGSSGGSEGVYYLLFVGLLGSYGTPISLVLWRFATYYLGVVLGGIIFATNKEINMKVENKCHD